MSSVSNDDRTQPWAQWEEIDVAFGSSANVDTFIRHTLSPPTAEHVNYMVIRNGQNAKIYHDPTGTRKPWGAGYILLRSDVANAKVTLLLTVSHIQRPLAF